MADTRKIPCSVCGTEPVTVGDYVEGDEHEVVCDGCEAKANQPECPLCDGFGFVRPEKRNLSSSDYCDCDAGKRIAKSDQSFLGEYLTEKE